MQSSDNSGGSAGQSWRVVQTYPPPYGVTYGNGRFVAVGGRGAILTSTDGVSWTAKNSGTSWWLYGVTYANGRFVAVGSRGAILTSTDGVSWTTQSSGTGALLSGVTYGNSLFVAVGIYMKPSWSRPRLSPGRAPSGAWE